MDLVPYLRIQAIRASSTGYPPVSAPALAFPEDSGSAADPYAYLLGPDLFVAPVVEPGAVERSLHLPPGGWVHWFTGERTDGPADVTVSAPIGTPPVFVRVGAILPMLPGDLDTLVEADPPLIDPADRPFLRAWIIPGASHEVITEEGLGLTVTHDADETTIAVTPGPAPAGDVRMRIELRVAEPPIATIGAVASTPGGLISESPDPAAVQAGCNGVCWARDATVLWLSVRSAESTTIRLTR
jgi:hypothetical protein